ncbi:hypothetical protein FOPG_19483 [Fusarium oxysporum f. sp. conglutinans race 2 54008]|uniref:Rhodopsin domain-containing protein n=1 Tax=Fusarium oxysporum f. sp. conglutinans race 2 54008 TaxID=1089457 RepID=X0HSV3_FUSOX|nr:hypothetical protein FOPG_19483 [Fusarium oxysporum f. sp. conglutinans race 2 54008]
MMFNEGVSQPDIDYTMKNFDVEPEQIEFVSKLLFTVVFPFFTALYLCKASLLAVYLQLFPRFMKTRRLMLWILIGYCACAYIVSITLQLFYCYPVPKNWQDRCSLKEIATVFQIAWSLHFAGSLALFVTPWFIVYNLNMRPATKIGVYGAFLIGIFDIAFSLTRFLVVQTARHGSFISMTTIKLWTMLDIYIGLVVTCLPALRPLLRKDRKGSRKSTYDQKSRQVKSAIVRRTDENGFEEIDDHIPFDVTEPDQIMYRPTKSPDLACHDEWSDKRSNKSDVELVHLKTDVFTRK